MVSRSEYINKNTIIHKLTIEQKEFLDDEYNKAAVILYKAMRVCGLNNFISGKGVVDGKNFSLRFINEDSYDNFISNKK